jgi:Trypsin-like peptidase domain
MICRILVLAGIFGVSTAQCQVCTGFGNGAVLNQTIKQEFSPAVVKVQDMGTAYLIDSDRGYFLTAGHVLDEVKAKNEPYEIVMGDPPYLHLAFKVVQRPTTADIALLQLIQSNAMKNVRPLDISFEAPDYDSSLFVMGYPHYGQQRNIFLRSGSAKLGAYPPDGSIEIDHTTVGGSSGGPLIDGYGDVVATAEEEIADGKAGRYLPLVAIEDLLGAIPVSSRMLQLETDLIAGKTDISMLREVLKKNPRDPTNLELYAWTIHLRNSPTSLKKISKYFRCPLVPAFSERHITDALVPFMAMLEPDQQGKLKLTLAEREYALGHNAAAAQFASESLKAWSEPPSTVPSTYSPLRGKALLLGWAIAEQKTLGNGQVVGQDTAPVIVTLDSGKVEKYLVQWIGTVDSTKVEEGHPAELLHGYFTDTRKCRWNIQSEVLRKMYYLDDKEHVSTEDAESKIFAGGFANQGSDFVFSSIRPENCNDAAPRYLSDVGNAKSAVGNHFRDIISDDRGRIVTELAKLPHVKEVKFGP